MLEYLVFLGAIVQISGLIFYAIEVIQGKAKPNRVTWLLWSIAPLIATVAALSTGVRWSVLPVFMCSFGPLIIFLVSFVNKESYWKLNSFDYFCGAFSVLALILWWLTKQAELAIIFSIISDFFAAIPTLIKSWKEPWTETLTPYLTGLFGIFSGFAVIKMWTFSELAFPIYLVIINIALVLIISRKKRSRP